MGALILLAIGVATVFARPRSVPPWLGPVVCAVVGVASTLVPFGAVRDSLRVLRDPLLFLLFAVPLAVALDRVGVFSALAAAVDGGRHLVAWLWVLAAGVTVVFNLDAAVVLLTPLYLRIARRHGLSAEMLAFQPALLACLASGPLPVSNLTNLIVAEQYGLGVGDFLRHMALPTVAACSVGWWAFRGTFHLHPQNDAVDEPVELSALRRGLPIVGFVLVGFTLGDLVGVPAWVVAAAAAAWACAVGRDVPWRTVPYEAMLLAVGLAVLVAGALAHLGLRSALDAGGVGGQLRALAVGVAGSDLVNNLPAVLAAGASLRDRDQVWPLLVGVNMGPLLVISGSLSGLLWRDTAARLGLVVSARRYSVVGATVGLPAMAVAALVVVVV